MSHEEAVQTEVRSTAQTPSRHAPGCRVGEPLTRTSSTWFVVEETGQSLSTSPASRLVHVPRDSRFLHPLSSPTSSSNLQARTLSGPDDPRVASAAGAS